MSLASAAHSSLVVEEVCEEDSIAQTSTRIRRSRFDVPPAPLLPVEDLPTLSLIHDSQPRFGVGSSEAALSYLAAPIRQGSSDTGIKTFSLGGYEIVLQRKLEHAMTRNFEYLLRKDASPLLPVEQMPRMTSWGAGKDFARVKKQATPGELLTLYHPTDNPHTLLGVGASAPSSSQAVQSIVVTETSAVYVSGFPLDFDEDDLSTCR